LKFGVFSIPLAIFRIFFYFLDFFRKTHICTVGA
jgi:hypothetical protein